MKVQVHVGLKEKRLKLLHSMPERLIKKLDRIKRQPKYKQERLSRAALINSIVDSAISSPRFRVVFKK